MKSLEAPETVVVMLIFLVVMAILIILVAYFSGNLSGSTGFKNYTNFSKQLGWG